MTAETERNYPLSPTQHGMLFHSLSTQHSGVDLEQIVCALRENLNATAFQQAWERVVARHAALRASFHWEGLEEPRQYILPHLSLVLEQHDWRDMPVFEQQHCLKAYLRSDRERGFDLARAPLMRLALLRMGKADYQCVWTFPHILIDGRSHLLVLEELFTLYEALLQGQEVRLAPASPYENYLRWLARQDPSEGEAFWRSLLRGFTAPTPLSGAQSPSRALEPREETHGEQELRLSIEITSALQHLAHQHNLTPNTFIQGAWAILLSRTSGEEDTVFGAVRAGRRSTVDEAESMVGMFINTLPVRVHVSPEKQLLPWLQDLRAQGIAVRKYEHTPLVQVQGWSDVSRGAPLFESIVVFDNYLLNSALRARGGSDHRTFRLYEKTTYPLALYGYVEPALLLKIAYDRRRFDDATITRMLGHLETVLEGMATHPERRLADIPLLTQAERQQLLVAWNDTRTDYPRNACIHHQFEAQVERSPDAVAVVFADRQLTYRELNRRANQLAHYLQKLGVGPNVLVGICVERSLEMMVGLLGILKAGGAYVPLDPAYPPKRLAFLIEDSRAPVLLTQQRLVHDLPTNGARIVCLDTDWEAIAQESTETPASGATADNLAYVIYTSGSTGQPKGVMVGHRNVVNFFAGMDQRIPHDPPGVWLAVTSISFDISILELFWTLARGFKVILQAEQEVTGMTAEPKVFGADREMAFSLFYFASNEGESPGEKYRLLVEGTKFADQHGFTAVWTPERHFHAFGGLYPNPSVISAALAMVTERIQLRAGSIVLPLHDSIRVAEEWSLVDNLSRGRVAISFASGWHPNDFVLAPANYPNRKDLMFREIDTVRKLWRGESVCRQTGDGKKMEVHTLPRPVQRELPIWITAAGSPDTFRMAGEIGANILTHLLGQRLEDLAKSIGIYREAWRAHGHPGEGVVSLMLHTFVGADMETVREKVREPFSNYLKTSLDLVKMAPSSFPMFNRPSKSRLKAEDRNVHSEVFTKEDMEALVAHAFERYFETSGLFGTPDSCLAIIDRLTAMSVNEVACLIDFGVETDAVLSSLHALRALKELCNVKRPANRPDYSLAAQIRRHGVTHMQCTPSMARMLTFAPDTLEALGRIPHLLLGGEALPVSLAAQLRQRITGRFLNMYGPTETTIWSTTSAVDNCESSVPIGRPIANTRVYVLDRHQQPVPVGVAGELYIGGDGVVQGYLNRPDLTAERFVPDPFHQEPGARLYRTGDLVRYLPDGSLEFLGRTDFHVKIRGHRIELGEIEIALEQHPSVHEAIVVAREEATGDTRLVAYLTTHRGANSSTNDFRTFLKAKLADAMVPSAFVVLPALPLTPNGKIDRRALPAPETERPELDKPFVAPRTPVEEVLASVWSRVLGIDQVGIHDNFFDLGGDSILAVQIIAKTNQEGLRLTVRQLLDHQTIAELACVTGTAAVVKAEQGIVTGPVILTPIQRWLFEQQLPDLHHYCQSMLLKVPEALDLHVLEHAVRALPSHHDALRLRFTNENGSWKQANAGVDAEDIFSHFDLSPLPEEEQQAALKTAIAELQASLNLSKGPLLRVAHFDLGAGRPGRLLLVVHHLAIDGVSWRILLEDLEKTYVDIRRGEPVRLPPKTTSFQEWATSLAEHARSPEVQAEAPFWLSVLDKSIKPIPVDVIDGTNTEASAQMVTISLSAAETRQLLQDVPAAYNTQINDVLLTALVRSISHWTGDRILLVDLEGHGREEIMDHVDISRTVGWFTSLFPVTLAVEPTDGPGEALKAVKEQLRRLPNHGIGYGLLRFLSGEGVLRESLQTFPQAAIQFNYLGQFNQLFSGASLFKPAAEPPGAFARVASPNQLRPYLLEILGIVVNEELRMMWLYSENVHQRSTVEGLANAFTESLRVLIAHCCTQTQREFTPSDFPLANLNQAKLDKLAAKLRQRQAALDS